MANDEQQARQAQDQPQSQQQGQQQNQQQNQQQGQQQGQQQNQQGAQPAAGQQQAGRGDEDTVDGLKDKKPEDLTPEELRLMADTMPGEGPGD